MYPYSVTYTTRNAVATYFWVFDYVQDILHYYAYGDSCIRAMIEALCTALWSIRTCRSPQSKNPVYLLRPDRKNVNNIITHLRHGDYIESLISRDVSEVFQFNFTSITVHGITSDNSAYSNTGYSMRDKHAVKQDQKAVLQSAREIHSEIRCSHR